MARPSIHLVTFADGTRYTTDRLVAQAQASEYFTHIHAFAPSDFDKAFWQKHQAFITGGGRGYGFWIWKYYFCARVLAQIRPGDVIVYMDSGSSLNTTPPARARFQDYVSLLEASPWGILQFKKWLVQEAWTKQAIFIFFDADTPLIRKTSIRLAGVFLLRKCAHSQRLLDEISALIEHQQYWLFSNDMAPFPELSIRAHQHDQAVLGVLTKKLGGEVLSNELEMAAPYFPLQLTRHRG